MISCQKGLCDLMGHAVVEHGCIQEPAEAEETPQSDEALLDDVLANFDQGSRHQIIPLIRKKIDGLEHFSNEAGAPLTLNRAGPSAFETKANVIGP